MSELYDEVVKILAIAAKRQEELRKDRPLHTHQWLVARPSDWAAIQNELGGPDEIRVGQTPGTWLLGVGVLLDEEQLPGVFTLRTEEHY